MKKLSFRIQCQLNKQLTVSNIVTFFAKDERVEYAHVGG